MDGDDIPDVAIGRLPTGLPREVATVVQKTIAYEAVRLRTNGTPAKAYAAIMPGWNNEPGTSKYYKFDLGCDRLIAPLEDAGRVYVPCRAPANNPTNVAYIRTNILFPALQEGCGLLYFFGHGNETKLGSGGRKLLYAYDDIVPANWDSPVIMMSLSCMGNVWHWLSESRTLIPYGLFAENTGFVAALAAAGSLMPGESEALGVAMFEKAEQERLLRFGDVYLAGLREVMENRLRSSRLPPPARNPHTERLLCISLIGDPALIWRHDTTATNSYRIE